MDKEKIKAYLGLDFTDHDNLIDEFIELAKAQILETTGVKYSEEDVLYCNLIRFLVVHWYGNRDVVVEKQLVEMPYSITTLMTQIGLRRSTIE